MLPEDGRFVFIGGLHRSGTTLLADLIASSDKASGLENTGVRMDEGQFLQNEYPIGKELGGVTRWAFDARAHMTEREAEHDLHATERLWADWSAYWRPGADYYVEKTPLNLTKTRYLQRLFPNSSFVIITRHPITQGLAIRKWSPTKRGKLGLSLPGLIEHWVHAHEIFLTDAPHVRRLHVIRYEHLMNDPGRVVADLEGFLGYPIDSSVMDRLDPAISRRYATEWYEENERKTLVHNLRSLPRSFFRGRDKLRGNLVHLVGNLQFPKYAREIDELYAARIRNLGYDVNRLDFAESW